MNEKKNASSEKASEFVKTFLYSNTHPFFMIKTNIWTSYMLLMPLTIGNDKAQIFSFQVKRTWIGTVLRKIQGQEHRPNKCLLINACSWLFFADDTNFNDNIDIQFFTDFYLRSIFMDLMVAKLQFYTSYFNSRRLISLCSSLQGG